MGRNRSNEAAGGGGSGSYLSPFKKKLPCLFSCSEKTQCEVEGLGKGDLKKKNLLNPFLFIGICYQRRWCTYHLGVYITACVYHILTEICWQLGSLAGGKYMFSLTSCRLSNCLPIGCKAHIFCAPASSLLVRE